MSASTASLLLEIGVEELPARFCPSALEQLQVKGQAALREARLPFAASRVLGTPRRLAWLVDGLAARQDDQETVARGPARAAAFDAAGLPTRAAEGFARSQGVAVEALAVDRVHDREYVFARRTVAGRPAAEVLAGLCPQLIASLDFPRKMRWGSGDFLFPRPIRWLVALLGPQVVPFDIEGLVSGRTTYGHRTLHPAGLELARPEEYAAALRAAFVLADVAERRAAIWAGVREAVATLDGRPSEDAELLDEVTHINEWPTAFVGRFDPAALALPKAVLITVMRVHQRYFPIEGASGALLPYFAGVRNGGAQGLAGVAAGNEKVLAARLADARFFYAEDRRQTLEARVPRLHDVAFAEGLGTLAGKAARLERLAAWLAGPAGADPAEVARAAQLCKADRLTHLVYELPELEGTMGGHYAAGDGEPDAVAAAIAEHVLPRSAGDALPASPAGRVLAVADRLDTLAGHFMCGRQPTGSADPFGLRRAATALVRLLEAAGWDLDLQDAVAVAAAGYPAGTGEPAGLPEFLTGRLRVRLEEAGFRHDVVDAVLAAGAGRVGDAFRRCRALTEAMAADGWEDTITAWRRAAHLARQGQPGREVGALRHPAERALAAAVAAAQGSARDALAAGDAAAILAATASLRRPVDEFLTALLAMDADPEVRRTRLALLAAVAALPAQVADLGRLAGDRPAVRGR